MESLEELISIFSDLQPEKLFSTLLIILAALLIKWGLNKLINARIKNINYKYRFRKISSYLLFALTLLLLLVLWFDIKNIITILGLGTAGLAIALRDPLSSFIGWLFILWKRPFVIGDRIEIGTKAGDVIDISPLQFSLIEIGNWIRADQSTGRVVHIPNRLVFNQNISNYSTGFSFIWNEISVLITFESNWEKAQEILMSIIQKVDKVEMEKARKELEEAANKYLVYYKNLTPIVYIQVEESGILLNLRYICRPHKRRTTEDTTWKLILTEFRKNPDIEFAYPTRRVYHREIEKPPGMSEDQSQME